MICRYCNKEMNLDDKDFNFAGCFDNYWICTCGWTCMEKVRYNQSFEELWHLEAFDRFGNPFVRDFSVKKDIVRCKK